MKLWPTLAVSLFALPLPCLCGGEALKALETWLEAYRAGQIDLRKNRLNQDTIAVRFGLLEKARARELGQVDELRILARAVRELEGADAARLLLQLAAIGLDRKDRLDPDDDPTVARAIGEEALDKLANATALAAILEVASEPQPSGRGVATQVAAMFALGRQKRDGARPVLELALERGNPILRAAAADALATLRDPAALPALAARVPLDGDGKVVVRMLDAMSVLAEAGAGSLSQPELRRATDAAIGVLGRGTWREDVSAVAFLQRVRSAQSVPALIGVLERFDPASRVPGERTGVLQAAAHEALLSLTGAVFAADQPARWREWWESSKDSFQVAPPPKSDAGERRGRGARVDPSRTVTGFFGIPVRGSRVLFVVDTSGSMRSPMPGRGTDPNAGTKLEAAQHELTQTVGKLTGDCAINLVEFGLRAKAWRPRLVPAEERHKKLFAAEVAKLRADGGTNLWAGLVTGLGIESLAYGEGYKADVDELFILSDGLPSLGDIVDPREILRVVRETNAFAKVRINTVYIGGDDEGQQGRGRGGRGGRGGGRGGMSGAEFMRRLAAENGGSSIEL